MRRRPRGDAAVSEVLGVVIMVVLVVAMAAGLFLWIGIGGTQQAPVAIGLSAEGLPKAGTAAFLVNAVSAPTNWSEIHVELNGKRLSYDDQLDTDGEFCVSRGSGSCISSLSWNPKATSVQAGQTLMIHDTEIRGATLRLIHQGSNGVVLAIDVP